MRILCGMMIVTLGFGVACANRSGNPPATTTQTGTGATPTAGPAGGRGQAAGAAQPTQGVQPRLTTGDHKNVMKTIGTTYPAMRKNLMDGMTAQAAKEAQVLAETFGNVELFWTQNNKPDAIKLAQQARTYATETAGAATAGDAAKATATATNLQGMCKQCHGLYREMDPANPGGYRIKPGMIAGS